MLETIAAQIADIEVIIALALALIFTLGYVSLFNWRKTPEGRAVLFFFISLIVVSGLSFPAMWVSSDYWLRPVWRALGWGFVVFSLGNLLWVLYRAFRKDADPLSKIELKHTDEIRVVKTPEE